MSDDFTQPGILVIVWYARTLLFGMPEHYCLVYQNIYPGKGRNVKGGPD